MELIDQSRIMKGILDSYPYPIVFVDDTYTIRFLNRYAEYHYYQERGYGPLLGKSIFDCHDQESSKQRIRAAFEKMKKDGKEIFLKVNARNQRLYMQPVRDESGRLIGFFERFELNLEVGSEGLGAGLRPLGDFLGLVPPPLGPGGDPLWAERL